MSVDGQTVKSTKGRAVPGHGWSDTYCHTAEINLTGASWTDVGIGFPVR